MEIHKNEVQNLEHLVLSWWRCQRWLWNSWELVAYGEGKSVGTGTLPLVHSMLPNSGCNVTTCLPLLGHAFPSCHHTFPVVTNTILKAGATANPSFFLLLLVKYFATATSRSTSTALMQTVLHSALEPHNTVGQWFRHLLHQPDEELKSLKVPNKVALRRLEHDYLDWTSTCPCTKTSYCTPYAYKFYYM